MDLILALTDYFVFQSSETVQLFQSSDIVQLHTAYGGKLYMFEKLLYTKCIILLHLNIPSAAYKVLLDLQEVKRRLSSEAAAAASRCSRWKNQMRQAAHNGCCRRVALSRALFSVLWKLLTSGELMEALLTIESPLVRYFFSYCLVILFFDKFV